MNTRATDGHGQEGRTLLPSADSPEPDYEDGEDIVAPRPIPPLPGGSRVNPHGVRRSAAAEREGLSTATADASTATARRAESAVGMRDSGAAPAPGGAESEASQDRGAALEPSHSGHDWGEEPSSPTPTSMIGVVGGAIALTAALLAAIATFVPFLSIGERLTLWGADTGGANAYFILSAAALGAAGAIAMLASTGGPKRGLWGGLLSMVAGVAVGGIAAYLVMNADHRAVIAQGGTFGAAAWLIIASAGGLLIGGILGLVHGSRTRTEGSR